MGHQGKRAVWNGNGMGGNGLGGDGNGLGGYVGRLPSIVNERTFFFGCKQ